MPISSFQVPYPPLVICYISCVLNISFGIRPPWRILGDMWSWLVDLSGFIWYFQTFTFHPFNCSSSDPQRIAYGWGMDDSSLNVYIEMEDSFNMKAISLSSVTLPCLFICGYIVCLTYLTYSVLNMWKTSCGYFWHLWKYYYCFWIYSFLWP